MPGDTNFAKAQVPSVTESAAEIERKNTEDLAMLSAGLFAKRLSLGEWYAALDQILRERSELKVEILAPRNFHQVMFFPGETRFGVNPPFAEIKYADDFHKGNGIAKLISYTAYRYYIDGRREVETYDRGGYEGRDDQGRMIISYEERYNPDGSKRVVEYKGAQSITTNYGPDGKKIEN